MLNADRANKEPASAAIINALSRSVSGVVLVAKSQAALQGLTAACRAGQIPPGGLLGPSTPPPCVRKNLWAAPIVAECHVVLFFAP